MTTSHNHAISWRTIADRLIPEQVEQMIAMESRHMSHRDLLEEAHNFASDNLGTKLYFGHLPERAGAVKVQSAGEATCGNWIRCFYGTKRLATEKDDISVEVQGTQYPDGTIERSLDIVYQDQNDPDDIGNLHIHPADARKFAAALIEAADEIDLRAREDEVAR